MCRITYIYGLVDPVDGLVKYIGKSDSPIHRFKSGHYHDKGKGPKYRWMDDLKSIGLKPIVKVLEVCKHEVWKEREQILIQEYKKQNTGLLNVLRGGECGREKPAITSDDLFELYVTQNLNRQEIGEKLGLSVRTIKMYLTKYRIEKPKSKWMEREEQKKSVSSTRLFKEEIAMLRNEGLSHKEIANRLGISRHVVANTLCYNNLSKKQTLSFRKILDESDGKIYDLEGVCKKYNLKPHTLREQFRNNRLKQPLKLI